MDTEDTKNNERNNSISTKDINELKEILAHEDPENFKKQNPNSDDTNKQPSIFGDLKNLLLEERPQLPGKIDLGFLQNVPLELRTKNSQSIKLEEVPVYFPFSEPYEQQKLLMSKVLYCIKEGKNCMLQSPTGTGKTMALLSAPLSYNYQEYKGITFDEWLEKKPQVSHKMKQFHNSNEKKQDKDMKEFVVPRIYYSTRTHSQIKQIASQIKKSCFDPISAVLSAPNRSCNVYKANPPNLRQLCYMDRQERKCLNMNNMQELDSNKIYSEDKRISYIRKRKQLEVCDLEDLSDFHDDHKMCTHFMEKSMESISHINLLPFHYIIDVISQTKGSSTFSNAVLIIDEAHNIAQSAQDILSITYNGKVISQCIKDLEELKECLQDSKKRDESRNKLERKKRAIQEKKMKEEQQMNAISNNNQISNQQQQEKQNDSEDNDGDDEGEVVNIFKKGSKRSKPTKYNHFSSNQDTSSGNFKETHTITNTQKEIIENFDKIIHPFEIFQKYLKEAQEIMIQAKKYNSKLPNLKILHYLKEAGFTDYKTITDYEKIFEVAFLEAVKLFSVSEQLASFIRIIPTLAIISNNLHLNNDPKLSKDPFIMIFEALDAKGQVISQELSYKYNFDPKQIKDVQMTICCLDPSIVFKMIQAQSPRSILLASGTLDPIDSLQTQLNIPFEKPLRNKHVVDSDYQVLSRIIQKGPQEIPVEFNFSYKELKNTGNDQYIALGLTVEKLAQTIPNGMLLVFPSYAIQNKCQKIWSEQKNPQIPSIMSRITKHKKIFHEPKNQKEFLSTIEQYKEASETKEGAILLCIQRAKATEGIDFSDKSARAVIIIGIPYSSMVSLPINAKMDFLDKNKRLFNVTGNEWYTQEAIKVVNQSIGRVIRHDKDYGAIYFIDKRYSEPKHHKEISSWAKPPSHFVSFDNILDETKQFLDSAEYFVNNKGKPGYKTPQKVSSSHNFSQTQYQTTPTKSTNIFSSHNNTRNANTEVKGNPSFQNASQLQKPFQNLMRGLNQSQSVQKNQISYYQQQNSYQNGVQASGSTDFQSNPSSQYKAQSSQSSKFDTDSLNEKIHKIENQYDIEGKALKFTNDSDDDDDIIVTKNKSTNEKKTEKNDDSDDSLLDDDYLEQCLTEHAKSNQQTPAKTDFNKEQPSLQKVVFDQEIIHSSGQMNEEDDDSIQNVLKRTSNSGIKPRKGPKQVKLNHYFTSSQQ